MGSGSSSEQAERRRQQNAELERRRAEARMREQQARDRAAAVAAASRTNNAGGGMGPDYPGSYSRRQQQFQQDQLAQQQALLQLQQLMRHMTAGGRGFQQAPAVQAVTEGRTISNECAVNTYSLQFDRATSTLTFQVVNNVPCEVEVHAAVQLDVYQGVCFATPNRQRPPPHRVPIDEPHPEGFQVRFVLDEKYGDIPPAERQYSLHKPKAMPVVISVLYQYDPNAPPTAEGQAKAFAAAAAASARSAATTTASAGAAGTANGHVPNPHEILEVKKAATGASPNREEFSEAEARRKLLQRRAEHTCLSLDPNLKVVKQLFELEGGTYLVEHLFGGEQEARVVSEETAAAQEQGAAGSCDGATTGGVVADSASGAGSGMVVDMDGDDDSTCVICLTEDRDTAVMPCRHLCLCRGCADELRKHTPKCPVCRGPIQQLLSMKKRK